LGWFAAVAVCLLAVCAAPTAKAIQAEVGDVFSLTSLIEENSTIEIGDKVFADFAFDSATFSVDTVLVKVIQVDGNWGLSVRDEWSAYAAEGDGSIAKGFRLEFSVAVARSTRS
jgi:hypothetical protein